MPKANFVNVHDGGHIDSLLASNDINAEEIYFTRFQLALLDKMFPECYEMGQTNDRIRERVGQRNVVAFIRARTR